MSRSPSHCYMGSAFDFWAAIPQLVDFAMTIDGEISPAWGIGPEGGKGGGDRGTHQGLYPSCDTARCSS